MDTKDIGAYILYSDGRVFKKSYNDFMRAKAPNSDGYLQICVYGKQRKMHRVLMEHFNPHPDQDMLTVNHIDGNKLNNSLNNLEWCTRGDNTRHAFRTGLMKPCKGSKNGASVLTEENVRMIKSYISSGRTLVSIAKEFGVTSTVVCRIKKGKSWTHVFK